MLVVTLLPLGLGPDLNLLSRIAPGVLWIALLLAALLSLPRMFEADDEDGSLDVLATGRLPLELAAAAKALAHWISTGIPLALMAPVLGLLLNLEHRGLSGAGGDHAGRHAGDQLPRRGRRGADAAGPARRAADRAAGAAALRADADFRHGGDLGCAGGRRGFRRRSLSLPRISLASVVLRPGGCGGGAARADAVTS